MNFPTSPIERIRAHAKSLGCDDALDALLQKYPDFTFWSGSHAEGLHHYGDGGLVLHTSEVINLGFQVIMTLELRDKVDSIEYFLAALFHDTGKMHDYEQTSGMFGVTSTGELINRKWQGTSHRRLIHHLPRSLMIWHDIVHMLPHYESIHDSVAHAILAHHGQREWGSPVAPKSRVAWLLHLCDSISARMNDADTTDVVYKK